MRADALRAAQRAFLDGLAAPLAGEDRVRAGLPPSPAPPSPAIATAVAALRPSPRLSAAACFDLYHRQYWFRLLDSLREDLPATTWLLGDAASAACFEAYLAAHPPRDRSLRALGTGLPAFAAAAAARGSLPSAAAELIALEDAWVRAFTAGAGTAVSAADLATARLALAPHVALIAARAPIDRLWRAARRGGPRPRRRDLAPGAKVRHLVVFRGDDGRSVERLHPAAHAVLATVAATGSLAEALAAAAPLLPARGAAMIRRWFATWCGRGWLVAAAPRISAP